MDLSEFRTALRTRLGVPTTDALFTDTVTKDLINAAIHYLEAQSDWPWLEKIDATMTGSASVSMPSDWLRTVAISRSGYPPLERRPVDYVRQWPTDAGPPIFYAHEGNTVLFRPVNAAVTLTHTYIRTETDLSGTSDEPLLPAIYHEAVVDYAAYLAFRRSGQLAEAERALGAFQGWLKMMLDRHGKDSPSEGGGIMPAADR